MNNLNPRISEKILLLLLKNNITIFLLIFLLIILINISNVIKYINKIKFVTD